MTMTAPRRRSTDLSAAYLRALNRHAPLREEELNALIRRAHEGDREAFDRVVHANLRFVVNVAAEFRNSELCFDERVAEGNIGLMRAVEKFDPDLGYKFTTYAVWWIRQAIQKAIWRHRQPFRLPLNHFEDSDRIRRTTEHLSQKIGRDPSLEEITAELAMTPRRVQAAIDTQQHALQLDAPTGEEQRSAHESLPHSGPDPHQMLEQTESTESVRQALQELPPRDAEILALIYGLDGEPLSFSGVARRLGISKERVRQLRNRALSHMRRRLRGFDPNVSPEQACA